MYLILMNVVIHTKYAVFLHAILAEKSNESEVSAVPFP